MGFAIKDSETGLFARWLLPLLALLSLGTAARAQEPVWAHHYGGQYNDQAFAGAALPDGGYIILGSTYSYGAGDHDIYLLRLNQFGDTLWTRSYGGQSTEYGHDIRATGDGGFVVTGITKSFGAGNGDVWLLRLDSLGNLLWSKTFGGTARDEGKSVRETADRGFVIAGTTASLGHGYDDVYFVRTDSLGNLLSQRAFGGTGGESGSAISTTPDGGYVLIGSTGSFGDGYSSIYVVRLSPAGDSVWANVYGGIGADFGYAVQAELDGSVLITGATSSLGAGQGDIYLAQVDANGILLWQQAYGGLKEERGYAIATAPDGNLIVAGTTESGGSGKIDCFVVKTDRSGGERWRRTYGGSESDFCRNLVVDGSTFCLIGYSYSYSSGGSDVYIVKAEAAQTTPVDDDNLWALPDEFELAQNYPNPFNAVTTIDLTLAHRADITVEIFNTLGQRVRQWQYRAAPAGRMTIQWDGRNEYGVTVASGIYLYRVTANEIARTRKMILLK